VVTALVRLVEIGRLRNGRPIYLPEPEVRIIELDAALTAYESERVEMMDSLFGEFASFLLWRKKKQRITRVVFALFVADHQRVWDAITTGQPRPFDACLLPTWAAILRG
jgi:hypothetical protein